MRINVIRWIAATLLLLGAEGAAQSSPAASPSDSSLLSIMAEIPQCGMNCLLQSMPSIGCGLLDVNCQCSSKNATKIVQPCLIANCTYQESFKLLRVQAVLCDKPHNNRAMSVRITGWISVIVPVVMVTMRFSSRYLGGSKFWWDDWLQLFAVILIVPGSAVLILNSYSGLGYHIWDVTYEMVVDVGLYTYIATFLWAFNLLLLKFSILTLYLRIFPNQWLRRCIAAFSIFTILYTFPLIFLTAFQCMPIYAFWDLEAQKTAKCIDWTAVLRATVIFEIIAEVVLFVLPIPVVIKLQMPRGKKVLLMVFFGLGIGIIGISCARLPYLEEVTSGEDPTWSVVSTGVLGFSASIVGHVCAAVPTVRALQRSAGKAFKRVMLCRGDESGSDGSSRPSGFGANGSGGSGDGRGKTDSGRSGSSGESRDGSERSVEKGRTMHKVVTASSRDEDEEREIPLVPLRPTLDRGRLSEALFSRPWNASRERDTVQSYEQAMYRDAWGSNEQSDRVSDAASLISNNKRAQREVER